MARACTWDGRIIDRYERRFRPWQAIAGSPVVLFPCHINSTSASHSVWRGVSPIPPIPSPTRRANWGLAALAACSPMVVACQMTRAPGFRSSARRRGVPRKPTGFRGATGQHRDRVPVKPTSAPVDAPRASKGFDRGRRGLTLSSVGINLATVQRLAGHDSPSPHTTTATARPPSAGWWRPCPSCTNLTAYLKHACRHAGQ